MPRLHARPPTVLILPAKQRRLRLYYTLRYWYELTHWNAPLALLWISWNYMNCKLRFEWKSIVVQLRKTTEKGRMLIQYTNMSDSSQSLTKSKSDYSETYSTFEDENGTDGERKFKVGDAIEEIGFGRFQVCLGLVVGIALIADGMEIMVVSILGPVLICEWNIDVYQEALLTTVVFLGFLIGSPAFRWLGDTCGRRNALMMSSSWVSIFGILSALATN